MRHLIEKLEALTEARGRGIVIDRKVAKKLFGDFMDDWSRYVKLNGITYRPGKKPKYHIALEFDGDPSEWPLVPDSDDGVKDRYVKAEFEQYFDDVDVVDNKFFEGNYGGSRRPKQSRMNIELLVEINQWWPTAELFMKSEGKKLAKWLKENALYIFGETALARTLWDADLMNVEMDVRPVSVGFDAIIRNARVYDGGNSVGGEFHAAIGEHEDDKLDLSVWVDVGSESESESGEVSVYDLEDGEWEEDIEKAIYKAASKLDLPNLDRKYRIGREG